MSRAQMLENLRGRMLELCFNIILFFLLKHYSEKRPMRFVRRPKKSVAQKQLRNLIHNRSARSFATLKGKISERYLGIHPGFLQLA
jgi:hypothetical protein